MTAHRQIHVWTPTRRTRHCEAEGCGHREQVRTTAILTNGREPLSLCTRHWTTYQAALPQYDRDQLVEGQP